MFKFFRRFLKDEEMDRLAANFYDALASIKDRLDANTAVLQLPIGYESEFAGVVDLITMKALIWQSEDLGASWDVVDIPDDLEDQAEQYRAELVETVATALATYSRLPWFSAATQMRPVPTA